MSPWGSRWLEHEMTYDNLQDEDSSDARNQHASASCRPHGARWYSFVQGIRRSLDVHLKSYYKIDNAFSSASRLSSASSKLQALSRGLTDTGLLDFCCFYLVHPVRGTFGIVALSGAGAQLFPPLLSDGVQAGPVNTRHDIEQGSCRVLPNIFTRCVFQVQDSNWSVEDVVTSGAPWYYDCTATTNGFGLPTDGGWLRRAGMRSVLALPAMGPGGDVTGVLAVATKQKTLDHLLLRKLEDLCYKLTPIVADAVEEHVHLLANRRLAAPYESIADFAHEVLGELLNLDRAVAVSSCSNNSIVNGGATGVNPSQQRQHQRQASIAAAAAASAASGKGHKSRKSDAGHFDAAAAVAAAAAAAAAAGFTWTGAPPARPTAHSTLSHAPPQPAQFAVRNAQQGSLGALQRVSPFAQNQAPPQHQQQTNSTFRTALTGAATQANSSLVLLSTTGDLVTPPQASSEDESGDVEMVQRSYPCPSTAPMHKQPLSQMLWTAPGVTLAQSLPAPGTVAAEGISMVGVIRGIAGPGAASTGDCVASRSTRSLSCLEFSGGVPTSDVREALVESGGVPVTEVREALGGQEVSQSIWTASAMTAASCSSRSESPCRVSVCAERWRRQSPVMGARQQQDMQAGDEAGAAGDVDFSMLGVSRTARITAAVQAANNSAGASPRSSGSDEALYMMDSRTADGLTQSASRAEYMMSPSSHQVDDRVVYQRGRVGDTSTPPTDNRSGASSSTIWTLAAARGSTCATDASAAIDTTFGGTFTAGVSTTCTNNIWRLSSGMAALQSEGGRGQPDVIVRDLSESRWSRDSAAAAAAVWNNEATEAFAAALRFTAAAEEGAQAHASAKTVTRSCASAGASQQVGDGQGEICCGADILYGGLYDIRESGPVPSHVDSMNSLVEEDEEDCSVELSDWPAGGETGAFLLSSGLGAEALERRKQQC